MVFSPVMLKFYDHTVSDLVLAFRILEGHCMAVNYPSELFFTIRCIRWLSIEAYNSFFSSVMSSHFKLWVSLPPIPFFFSLASSTAGVYYKDGYEYFCTKYMVTTA